MFVSITTIGANKYRYLPIDRKKAYTVVLSQKNGKFSVTLNGLGVWSVTSPSIQFSNVRFWLSNPWEGFDKNYIKITNLYVNAI